MCTVNIWTVFAVKRITLTISIAVCIIAKLGIAIPTIILTKAVDAIIVTTGRRRVLGPRSLPRAAGVRAVRRAGAAARDDTAPGTF